MSAVWKKGSCGEWLVYGPAAVLNDKRGPIAITRKDGSVEHRRIFWTSRPFLVEGVPHCLGRPEQTRPCSNCQGLHLRDDVRTLYGRNLGAHWREGEKHCSCGGALASVKT